TSAKIGAIASCRYSPRNRLMVRKLGLFRPANHIKFISRRRCFAICRLEYTLVPYAYTSKRSFVPFLYFNRGRRPLLGLALLGQPRSQSNLMKVRELVLFASIPTYV